MLDRKMPGGHEPYSILTTNLPTVAGFHPPSPKNSAEGPCTVETGSSLVKQIYLKNLNQKKNIKVLISSMLFQTLNQNVLVYEPVNKFRSILK